MTKPKNPRSVKSERYKFHKSGDPFEEAREEAARARQLKYKFGIPKTYEAQGLIGLRKYAETWFNTQKARGQLGPMFHTKQLFMEWFGDHPRPGNCRLVQKNPKEKCTPHNVKWVSAEAFRTVMKLQKSKKGDYFGVVYDKGFKNHPPAWRGEFRAGDYHPTKKGFIYREFSNERQAARWVDYCLEKKYGIYCVLNRDVDPTLGHEDFSDVPLELSGW